MAFCTVARHGSVTRAAEALGLSQPALSRQLAALQAALGFTLYERAPYGIKVTPAGEDLLPYACAVAQTLTQAERYLANKDDLAPVMLRVGLSHHLVNSHTRQLLEAAHREGEGSLTLHLVEGYSSPLAGEVAKRNLDAALVIGERDGFGQPLAPRRCGEEQIVLLVKPDDPLAAQAYAPLTVLRGASLFLPSSASFVYRRTRTLLARAQVTPGRLIEVSGPSAVRSAVTDGLGVGVTLRSFVRLELKAGLLKTVALEDNGFTVGIFGVSHDPETLEPATRRALARVLHVA